MAQYNEDLPLAPTKEYPRSDQESAAFPPSVLPKLGVPVTRRRTNKCFVCILFVVVILSCGVLAFSLTVLRVEAPQFKLREAAVNNLNYNNNISTRAQLRGTLVGEVTLRNKNFGTFKHGNGTVNVLHGENDFGGRKVIDEGRVKGRETKRVMASIEFVVSVEGEGENNTLREEIGKGMVRIRSYGEVGGEVNVLGLMKKKKKVAVMDCNIRLDLSTSRIKDLFCK